MKLRAKPMYEDPRAGGVLRVHAGEISQAFIWCFSTHPEFEEDVACKQKRRQILHLHTVWLFPLQNKTRVVLWIDSSSRVLRRSKAPAPTLVFRS